MPFFPRDKNTPSEPMFNLPPMVQALLMTNLLVFVMGMILPAETALEMIERFAFIPERYSDNEWSYEALISPFTAMFLHAGLLHLSINMAMLIAFGSGIERYLGSARMLAFYILCGFAGFALHWVFYPETVVPVVGASGAISGLFGGLVILIGRQQGSILTIVAIWLVFNLLSGTLFTPTPGMSIAWQAHMGGFFAGLLLLRFFEKHQR